MALFPENSESRLSKIGHRCIHSEETLTCGCTILPWARRSIFVQKFTKWRGWSSKCTVLEVWGQAGKGVPEPREAELQGLGPRDFLSRCFLY